MKKKLVLYLFSVVLLLSMVAVPMACCTPEPDALEIFSIGAEATSDTTVTITWSTDRDATGQVLYGADATPIAYGSETVATTTYVKAHSVNLTGLTAGVTYNYKVASVDEDAVSAMSPSKAFNTTGLVISDVVATPGSNKVTITWTTDDASDSQVEWGATTAYGNTTTLDATEVTSHSVMIANLTPAAVYHYKVMSASDTDDDVSADATFTMTAAVRLTAAITDEPSTLNPFTANKYPQSACVGIVMEPLVLALEDGSMVPWLAEDWTISTDGLEWTFNIDPDATWSDGQSVTADDVVFTYDLHFDNTGWTQSSSIRALVKQDAGVPADDAITKVDADTVMFKLEEAYGTFLSAVTTVFVNPKHIWEPKMTALAALDPPVTLSDYAPEAEGTFADEVIGSGPFKFAEYVDTQYVKYVANTNYWKGAPNVDEVVFRIFQEEDAALLAFRAGEIDALAMVETPTDIPLLLQDTNITVDMLSGNNHTAMLFLNLRKPPLHILDVRKAVDMTIDRQDLINSATYGYGSQPQQIPFAGGLAESNPDIAWVDQYVDGEGDLLSQTTRTANANTLLDAIPGMSAYVEGETRIWTDPVTSLAFDMAFDLNYIGAPTYQRGATEITKTLEDIGIALNPAPFAGGMFGPTLFSGMMVWNYDFVLFGYPSPPEFDQLVKQWSNDPFGGNYDGAVVGFNNNPADPYVDNGVDKPGDPLADPQKPQTYDTPDWDTATADEKALYKSIYDGIVAWATPIEEDLYATKLMTDPVVRLAAIMAVQQDFADALPILSMYHEVAMSAYRTDRFTGWGNPMGVFFYGNSPASISPLTLAKVELK